MSENRKTIVVNLFGGPGSGKTVCSWIIAAELKKRGFTAEYVPEYAKELVWDNEMQLLDGSLENQKKFYVNRNTELIGYLGK